LGGKACRAGCTFNKGKTTCTTTEHTGTTYYTHVVGEERCGNAITGFYYEPVFQNYRTDTYRETTTVSRGNKIISSQSREYQTTTLVGGRYGGC
jgi:hypothetical protein